MKFRLKFKEDDGTEEDLRYVANESLKNCDLDEDEIEAVFELRVNKLNGFINRWVGKTVTLEFDTEEDTCIVVEDKQLGLKLNM